MSAGAEMEIRSKMKGFSLIELMVVVAVIAILASIAYPSYMQHIVKTRRSAGEACLLEQAQFMERYYTTNMKYSGAALPGTGCAAELAEHYAFAFEAGPAATTYTIAANPQGSQAARDSCGKLTINQVGVKTPDTSGCW